ncbi:hypothetical protein GI374_06930 [Paracoccus sp. S-4012]|uniref:hypothetical protein n=1 Tax=Paracoccus sp. S-4012 TaxID=2665648 RepID=UPI0012B09236|nr:hypothetical protein [Paracoccus sp. S-4012]MRX50185.1 hypothetical protein [Paracoccus sp. S-4012]
MICDGKATRNIRRFWCKDIGALIVDGVRIPIVRTCGPLGGMRNWWLCPQCGRRCELLYGETYICRICAKGRYRSELASPRERKLLKAFKIRERLGQTSGGIIAPFPAKPKYMHWNTYLRTRAEAEQNELRILQDELADLKRTSKVRR